MGFLLFLTAIGLIIYLGTRHSGSSDISAVEYRLSQRNYEWAQFVAGYRTVAKTKQEKALVERMLADMQAQGLPIPAQPWPAPDQHPTPQADYGTPAVTEYPYMQPTPVAMPQPVYQPGYVTPAPRQLDNAALLLYFGAFLFVASMGLFVAFGGAVGSIRTLAVLLVTAVMYGGGHWLYTHKPKLQQAALAFVGIGMTIAPLVGVAAYYYVFAQTNASLVWFVTSLLCAAMYLHALFVLHRSLINYILIFTFLSLFESSVSVFSAPVYYFGWAMAVLGLILVALSRFKGFWPEMQESSKISSQLFLPLALLVSLAMLPTHGAGQLGISLIFAALYYGFETFNTEGYTQQGNASVSQLSAVAATLCLTYAASPSWRDVAIALVAINTFQAAAILLLPQKHSLWRNFGSLLLGLGLFGALLGLVSPGILLASLATLVAMGMLLWWRQRRSDAYAVGTLALMALPIAYGQYYQDIRINASAQTILLLATLALQFVVYNLIRSRKVHQWLAIAQQTFVISSVVVIVASFFAPVWMCVGAIFAVVAAMLLLAELEHDGDWATIAGFLAAVPMLRGFSTPGPFLITSLSALLLNIGLALRFRKEYNRWFSAILWLLLPVALGDGLIGGHWTVATYAWTYVLVVMALVFSRAIARGNLYVSTKVPLASYAKSASLSYVVGYWTAMSIALILALLSHNAQFHASAIMAVMAALLLFLSRFVENQPALMVFLPFIGQAILLSALRPSISDDSLTLYLLSSSVLAVAGYFVWPLGNEKAGDTYGLRLREASLITTAVAPLSIMFTGRLVWAMPFGLLVLGSVLYYHVRNTTQGYRELATGVIVAALLWFLWFSGVRSVQAYTHLIAVMFGAFAYWRVARNERMHSDQYIWCMLVTATVPLALQAIGGEAGGLYGWWLLLEQIGFMLLGMVIGRRVVTLWGLYVAVGAVLYQLRHLGWAALTFLALFLIGLAIYQLQKHGTKS